MDNPVTGTAAFAIVGITGKDEDGNSLPEW